MDFSVPLTPHSLPLTLSPLTPYPLPLTVQMSSSPASQYRAFLWLFTLAAIALLWPTIQGARRVLPESVGFLSGITSVLCLFTGAYFGWKGAQIRIEERNKRADAVALVMVAALLKDKSDAELEAAATKGGPAGEAARLILERRRSGLRPSGQIPTQPEVN